VEEVHWSVSFPDQSRFLRGVVVLQRITMDLVPHNVQGSTLERLRLNLRSSGSIRNSIRQGSDGEKKLTRIDCYPSCRNGR